MKPTGEYKFYATAVLLFCTTQNNYYLNNTFIFFKDHLLQRISRLHELVLVSVVHSWKFGHCHIGYIDGRKLKVE
jgi:hypothetical protein